VPFLSGYRPGRVAAPRCQHRNFLIPRNTRAFRPRGGQRGGGREKEIFTRATSARREKPVHRHRRRRRRRRRGSRVGHGGMARRRTIAS